MLLLLFSFTVRNIKCHAFQGFFPIRECTAMVGYDGYEYVRHLNRGKPVREAQDNFSVGFGRGQNRIFCCFASFSQIWKVFLFFFSLASPSPVFGLRCCRVFGKPDLSKSPFSYFCVTTNEHYVNPEIYGFKHQARRIRK